MIRIKKIQPDRVDFEDVTFDQKVNGKEEIRMKETYTQKRIDNEVAHHTDELKKLESIQTAMNG